MMQFPTPFFGRVPDQIGVLVPDLERGAKHWGSLWGLTMDDWLVFTFSPETLTRQTYRGREASYSMRLAIAGKGPQIEVIQPVNSPSIYTDWLATRGYGIHHLGYYVDSLEDGIGAMAEAGYEPVQAGWGFGANGTGHFAYFEPDVENGLVVELIEASTQRRESERWIRGA